MFCDLKLKINTVNSRTLFVLLPGGLHIGYNFFVAQSWWLKAKRWEIIMDVCSVLISDGYTSIAVLLILDLQR